MDSVTQFVLGASVGEAVAGNEYKNKAMLLGGIFGTIPDLDVLFTPFNTTLEQLAIHRGFSHSIFFAVIVALISGWVLNKLLNKQSERPKKILYLLAFWATITHPILDAFTVYGTQLFNPLTNYGVAFNSIFIIDLFYTLPLILGLTVILIRRNINRKRLAKIMLFITSLYLLLGVGVKYYIGTQIEKKYDDVVISDYMSAPTLSNLFLWYYVVRSEDDIYLGNMSIFDDGSEKAVKIERNSHLVDKNSEYYKTLNWFSKGFYVVDNYDEEGLVFHDLRFGRNDFFIGDEGQYIFSFKIVENNNKYEVIEEHPELSMKDNFWDKFYNRLWGN